jgi:hypothetical protein
MFHGEMFPLEQKNHMLEPWYITGICEGEAAFTYNRASNYSINLYFAIKLRADDKNLLSQIKDYFGVGKLYVVKGRPTVKFSGDTQPAVYYRVNKINEIDRVIEHFDKYKLAGKKLKQYGIWKEVHHLKKQYNKTLYPKVWELLKEMSNLTSKNTASKINRDG